MGKDLKEKKLNVGINQRSDRFYIGRFTTRQTIPGHSNIGITRKNKRRLK